MKLTAHNYQDALKKGITAEYVELDGFAEACFNDNSYDEISDYAEAAPDETDMENWGLSESEWRQAQEDAIRMAMYWHEEEN